MLGFVGMFGSGVDFEFGHHLPGEPVAWEHAFDGVFDEELGAAGAEISHGDVFLIPVVAGVKHVMFLVFFFAGDPDFIGIDDNDEVTRIHVRRVDGFMAPAEDIGNFHGEAAEDLVFGIDEDPPLFECAGFG